MRDDVTARWPEAGVWTGALDAAWTGTICYDGCGGLLL